MTRTHLATCCLTALLGATPALAQYDASSFSAKGRLLQPPPSGHTPGKDNGVGAGLHNAGEDCGICHTPGGKAEAFVFTISGTIYEDRLARRPSQGAEVLLEDIDGGVLSMTTNAAGNFWTMAPMASNPLAVASHGGTTHALYEVTDAGVLVPAAPDDSRTWQYKAWVKDGDFVRSMVTVAPVGGSTGTTPRMSCNMHHSPIGSTGAAWAKNGPTLRAYPASELSFRRHINPILRNKCQPCHVPGAKATRLVTASDLDAAQPTTVDYSAGSDFTSVEGSRFVAAGQVVVKKGFRAVVNVGDPTASPALAKTRLEGASAGPVHAGGTFFRSDDADYRAILTWIQEGARDN